MLIAEYIANAENRVRPFVSARRLWQVKADNFSKPVLLECDDKKIYWVKCKTAGRCIVAEQIVMRLGYLLNAPMARTSLVNIPQELIDISPELEGYPAGLGHGSEHIEGCLDSNATRYCNDDDNQGRHCALAVLYGWCEAFDQQYMYEKQPPHCVHSVDHGLFFPGQHKWSVLTLARAAPPMLDPQITRGCSLKSERIAQSLQTLRNIRDQDICEAVACPPDDWGISQEERIALAEYLIRRRDLFTV